MPTDADYKRAVKSSNLLEYIRICSAILRSLPRESVVRTRIYSDLLTLTDKIQKLTGNPRFGVLNEELRGMNQKGRKMEPDKIIFKLLAREFVSGENGTAELVVQNRNPLQIEVEIIEVSSKMSEIEVSGTRGMSLKPGEKKSLRLLLKPEVPGTLLVKVAAELKAQGPVVKREEFFELSVKQPRAGKEAPTANPEADPMPPQASASHVVTRQSPSGGGYDIELLVKKGKAEEWAKAIEEALDDESSIDLSSMASSLYEKRGYRGLLLSAFLIDLSDYTQKEALSVIKGDSFTSRGLELLFRLRKEKKISLSPTTSDQNYMRDALNILTGNQDKSPVEKKKIKRWELEVGGKHLIVAKQVIKEANGRAKSFIFEIEGL